MIDDLNIAVLEAYTPVCPACGKRYPECRDMRPASSLSDAAAVEDEIDRRGLWEQYMDGILEVLDLYCMDFRTEALYPLMTQLVRMSPRRAAARRLRRYPTPPRSTPLTRV